MSNCIVLHTIGAVDTIRVYPKTNAEALLDDLMRGEVYDEHLQKEIKALFVKHLSSPLLRVFFFFTQKSTSFTIFYR